MKKVLKEFRDFAVKGNVLDLAVGVIIGGAFGKIVTSMVNDIIMPPIGKLLGNMNFADLYIQLDNKTNADGSAFNSLDQARKAGSAVIAYGNFINVALDFFIVAFCVFLIVKGANSLRRLNAKEAPPAPAAPAEKDCPHCLSKVPVQATRCKFCTSYLNEPDESAPGIS